MDLQIKPHHLPLTDELHAYIDRRIGKLDRYLDRVTDATGRLGPVGDAGAMAANIQSIWSANRAAMRHAARRHALQFSWDSSMAALFGRVYPAAFERRFGRQPSRSAIAVAAA